MTALILTPAELALLRQGHVWVQVPTVCAGCGMTECGGSAIGCHSPGRVPDPAILAAAEPCETCDLDGCDVANCRDCGEDYLEPCDRHLAAGHVSSSDPYGDGIDCHSCCPDCAEGRKRIEIRVACPTCGGKGEVEVDCGLMFPCGACGVPDEQVTQDNAFDKGIGTVLVGTASVAEVLPGTEAGPSLVVGDIGSWLDTDLRVLWSPIVASNGRFAVLDHQVTVPPPEYLARLTDWEAL